ncbi:hypothetical protein PYCC9005_001954 [Savitreella phatthalungensis]
MSRMLEKSEEVSESVTWEDQSMINTFSKLVARLNNTEEDLKLQTQEKEYLDDLEGELELADDDELVMYKVGDTFAHLPLLVAKSRLTGKRREVESECDKLEADVSGIRDDMEKLKVKLKSKFGDSINLDA